MKMQQNIFLPNGVRTVNFIAGAAAYSQLPSHQLPEIAFLGRSNVGKSSAINALLGRKGIAKVSQTPGRTQQINLFQVDKAFILADLPGYGYARIAKSSINCIQELVYDYLQQRSSLIRLILLIDARRGITAIDQEVMQFLSQIPVSFQVVFTKIDKLNKADTALVPVLFEKAKVYPACHPSFLALSSVTKQGVPELQKEIESILKR